MRFNRVALLLFLLICGASANEDSHGRHHNHHGRKHHRRGYHFRPPTEPPADIPPADCDTETPSLPPVYPPMESPIEGPYPSFDYYPPVSAPIMTPLYGPAPYEIPDDSNFMPIPEDDPQPIPPPVHPDPNQEPWAVQGVVYCKSCNNVGIDTLSGASPLAGATVFLACRNGRSILSAEEAITDTNGYFFFMHTYNYDAGICDVTLHPLPPKNSPCKRESTLNGGSPARLEPGNASYSSHPFALYTVGPLAYEPANKCVI